MLSQGTSSQVRKPGSLHVPIVDHRAYGAAVDDPPRPRTLVCALAYHRIAGHYRRATLAVREVPEADQASARLDVEVRGRDLGDAELVVRPRIEREVKTEHD